MRFEVAGLLREPLVIFAERSDLGLLLFDGVDEQRAEADVFDAFDAPVFVINREQRVNFGLTLSYGL